MYWLFIHHHFWQASLGVHSTTRRRRYQSPDWIGLCSVLRPLQHSIGYMGDGFYRSKDPTNSIKVLKEMLQRKKQTTETTQNSLQSG